MSVVIPRLMSLDDDEDQNHYPTMTGAPSDVRLLDGPRAIAPRVRTGADILVRTNFNTLTGQRVGLITNQTGLVDGVHLVDRMHGANDVTLAAIFGPEHGFRGTVEAGLKVRDGIDPTTGVQVHSLYGKTRKPTRMMLANVDVLVFDIQDIGARFYTYISTMGLAMQAAAEVGIPFIVLDRPNPLGGNTVSGHVLEARFHSFVGQYPIPIVHGLTIGELALMIRAESWLNGLDSLKLEVIQMQGWQRAMRWPSTRLPWVPTSPNIPTFEASLVYPGIGLVGETQLVNEGRGTPRPFTQFGAPWLNAQRLTHRLNQLGLPGLAFEPTRYTPRSIPKVAVKPLFVGRSVNGVSIHVRSAAQVRPLELGMHVLAQLIVEARSRGAKRLFAKPGWFHHIAGTKRLHRMLVRGATGHAIVRSWRSEVARFERQRAPYLLYD